VRLRTADLPLQPRPTITGPDAGTVRIPTSRVSGTGVEVMRR
jgi:hypothetical protein